MCKHKFSMSPFKNGDCFADHLITTFFPLTVGVAVTVASFTVLVFFISSRYCVGPTHHSSHYPFSQLTVGVAATEL